jgi:hypothetical protein
LGLTVQVNNILLLVVWLVAAATIQPRGEWSRSNCIAFVVVVVVVVVVVGVDVDMGATSRWFACNQESVHDGFVVPLLLVQLSTTWW